MGALTPQLGIVCGMTSEVRALGRLAEDGRVRVGISGARPERAEAEARRLLSEGCRALMSWGLAGGLDRTMKAGDLVVPGAVVDEAGGCWPFAPDLVEAAADAVPSRLRFDEQGRGRCVVGVERMVMTLADKKALSNLTGALAADMESHRVAQVAAAEGCPALAVRAVGDTLERRLPLLAARALDEQGRPRLGAVAGGLLQRPWDIGALMRAKRDSDAALATLKAVAGRVVERVLERL